MKYSTFSKKRRVVVTGVGVISPNGLGKEIFWQNSMRGKSGISEIDFAKHYQFKSHIGGAVKDFNPDDRHFPDINKKDRYIQFALAATKMAIEEAKLNVETINRKKVGVSIANAICGTKHMEQEFLRLTHNGFSSLNPTLANPSLFCSSTFNMASTEVAHFYHLLGPCCTIPTGCAAGLDAIGFCLDLIRSGDADVMITGASEAPLTPMVMASFDAIGALSSKYNDTPTKASRPYDATRDGFVLGESCGILVLEEREHAILRGATILAEIKGYGTTCNAFHMTGLPEDGLDLARAIEIALSDANVKPGNLDYINSHGSSTPQNDANETAAYKKALGKKVYDIPVSSLKSMCGHALSAANAIETIATVCSITHQQIHPTINYFERDPKCDLNYVPNEGINHEVKLVLKNASGFSGIHSALILSHPEY